MSPRTPGAGAGKWSERFAGATSELMFQFNSSLSYDQRLAAHELRASIAHARMLGRQGIIPKKDAAKIVAGLRLLERLRAAGRLRLDVPEEDIHTLVEKELTRRIGAAGKKLHTARSRNDQVNAVTRLWLRDAIDAQQRLILLLRRALLRQAQAHAATVMPGYTHLQVAQPTTLGHHLHAYDCMLARDAARLADCRRRVNVLPLGAAALAGTGFAIDPRMVAKELGFDSIFANSMDAVADRDYAIEYAHCAAQLLLHLSRLGEEIVIWASQPFGFVRVADAFSTGSSIMPQKRNPDAAELLRGKAGRALGALQALMTMVKGQPLTYNKDNQEDKEALFDSAATAASCLQVAAPMVASLEFDAGRMRAAAEQGYAAATELADALVRKGVSFRSAHARVARLVRLAESRGLALAELPAAEARRATGLTAAELRAALTIDRVLAGRRSPGSPQPKQVARAAARELRRVEKLLAA
ncbi:MAG: argininosuccinate lyase [Betaproteobacteria bacterium AqS2]|uniref:Argininosuccinate lyase n=1 Tax=Candidatus Amphirhobacter heronislandensis TaxID=1732024 RepID=A0A930UH18_9GAMM|nr:argininosuccinate lyase [Betaproteobacteria bacterium AqS2]